MDDGGEHENDQLPFPQRKLVAVEFFSGIGGMRLALQECLVKNNEDISNFSLSLHAFDISLHANATYEHNFGEKVQTKLVEHVKARQMDLLHADLWTMSPPCQPFTTTRGAKMMDAQDKRCNGLKAIISLLNEMTNKPKYIFLENVKGFASSQMVQLWKQCLTANGYGYREFLVSPVQLGIPNHRQRYYMMCERNSTRWNAASDVVETEFPTLAASSTLTISEYLDPTICEDSHPYLYLLKETLQKDWAGNLGLVTGADTASHCFTAGYGRIFHRSTGSLLFLPEHKSKDIPERPMASQNIDRSDMLVYLGRVRRLAPHELFRLFGFPPDFVFPPSLAGLPEHQYKLIGNSINVTVVSLLMREMLQTYF